MKNTLALMVIHAAIFGILFVPDEKFQILMLIVATVVATYLVFILKEELDAERARKQTVINVTVGAGK